MYEKREAVYKYLIKMYVGRISINSIKIRDVEITYKKIMLGAGIIPS